MQFKTGTLIAREEMKVAAAMRERREELDKKSFEVLQKKCLKEASALQHLAEERRRAAEINTKQTYDEINAKKRKIQAAIEAAEDLLVQSPSDLNSNKLQKVEIDN